MEERSSHGEDLRLEGAAIALPGGEDKESLRQAGGAHSDLGFSRVEMAEAATIVIHEASSRGNSGKRMGRRWERSRAGVWLSLALSD